jgi:hypothetical protein
MEREQQYNTMIHGSRRRTEGLASLPGEFPYNSAHTTTRESQLAQDKGTVKVWITFSL